MFLRVLLASLAFIAASASAHAQGQLCNSEGVFDREFAADIKAGSSKTAHDPEIQARLQQPQGVTAEFRIFEAHRTKEFGSGVAFLFCDQTSGKGLRLTLNDVASSNNLSVGASRMHGPDRQTYQIPNTFLSVLKTQANRITFRKDAKKHLVIEINGEGFTIDPGFDIRFVSVQIFCSRSRVLFLDRPQT